jgi:vacuolar-type H+-ATPase subunit B/Vma2
LPPQPLKDLIESLGTIGDEEVIVDEDKFKDFRKEFDAKFTDEENQEAFDAVQNTLLNRKWLRDNHKTLETTVQTKRFHKLANMYRLDGNLDEGDFMQEAYAEAVR